MTDDNKCPCEDPDFAEKLYDKLTPEERSKVNNIIKALLGPPVDAELRGKLDNEINDIRTLLDSSISTDGKYIELLKRIEQLTDLKRDIDALSPKLLKKLMDLDPHTYHSNKRRRAMGGRGIQGFLRSQ